MKTKYCHKKPPRVNVRFKPKAMPSALQYIVIAFSSLLARLLILLQVTLATPPSYRYWLFTFSLFGRNRCIFFLDQCPSYNFSPFFSFYYYFLLYFSNIFPLSWGLVSLTGGSRACWGYKCVHIFH